MRDFNDFESRNVRFLVNKQVQYATIQVTETGLKKSILDATAPVRAYFSENGIHDYEKQLQGPENKRNIDTVILTPYTILKTQSSLYRPVTKKGDPRMWVYGIRKYISPNEIFAMISYQKTLYVINLTQTDIPSTYNTSIVNPIKDLIDSIHSDATSVSDELIGLIQDRMGDWIPTTVLADTGVGREVEHQLGIPMNPNKEPDYKGIELKSGREKAHVRSSLFTQAPNWAISKLKNSQDIVDKYGYIPQGYNHKCLHVTLSATKPNSQGLGLYVEHTKDRLEANEYVLRKNEDGTYQKVADVSAWMLVDLHNRLLTKHHETFWIDVESRTENGREYFRVTNIEHTKNPIPAQFDILLEQGKITVDFLLGRKSGGDTYSFKISKKHRPFLFPENSNYRIARP